MNKIAFLFARFTLPLLLLAPAGAQSSELVGRVIFAIGSTTITSENSSRPLKHGDQVSEGDLLQTGADGHIHLRMVDNAFIALRPESRLRLNEYQYQADKPSKDRVRLELEQGQIRSISGDVAERRKDRYRLNTPVAAIGVRGTDYTVVTTQLQSQVDVLKGGIAMSPFNSVCTADSVGPCTGNSVLDLYSSMDGHYLQLNSGDNAPDLIEGRLSDLALPVDQKRVEQPTFHATPADQQSDNTDTPETTDTASETDSTDSAQTPSETENDSSQTETDPSFKEPVAEKTDSDGDGVTDLVDAFPHDPEEQLDTDADGLGNNADTDDDNDGLSDEQELLAGSNPLLADTDGDGVNDAQDSNPTSSAPITVHQDGQPRSISEQQLAALQVLRVEFRTLDNSTLTGTVLEQSMVLASADETTSSEPDLMLVRRFDNTGRTFWGAAGSSAAWEAKISANNTGSYADWSYNNVTGDSSAPVEQLLNVPSHNSSWEKYYRTGNFTPIVENDSRYLNNVDGLQDAEIPLINRYLPSIGLIYGASTADIDVTSNEGVRESASLRDFDFKMNYVDQTFTAVLLAQKADGSTTEIRFNGTVNESGMVFGGNSDAFLKGFFINEMNQIALIFEASENGEDYAGTVIIDRHKNRIWSKEINASFDHYQQNSDRNVKWGRWSNYAEIQTEAEYAATAAGKELIARNRTFILTREIDENLILPTDGVVSFDVAASEAIYRNGSRLETASVHDASLTMNFNARSFKTELTVDAPSLANGIDINAAGDITNDGLFFSNSKQSNADISGALENGGNNATMIFERELNNGDYVSGGIDWSR